MDEYVKLAKQTIETYIKEHRKIDLPENLPDEMLDRRAGAFVSIHKGGSLRGCIGTILATTECVGEEIIQNAISASTRDPRFPAIGPDELKYLEINDHLSKEGNGSYRARASIHTIASCHHILPWLKHIIQSWLFTILDGVNSKNLHTHLIKPNC